VVVSRRLITSTNTCNNISILLNIPLYSYLSHKGTDQGYMNLKQYKEEKDEINLHKYGRILTANECHYRLVTYL
jgi:hypothetical protein